MHSSLSPTKTDQETPVRGCLPATSASMRPRWTSAVAVAWAVIIVGCGTQQIHVPRTMPAEVNLSKYKTIGVAGIGGPGGDAFADELTQSLFDSGRFQVVDRQTIDNVLREQQFGASGLVDPRTAAKVQRLTGAQCIVTGGVSRRDYNEGETYSDGTCYSNNQQYPCRTWRRAGKWSLNVGIKTVDTETGRILATKALTGGDSKAVEAIDAHPAVNWITDDVFDDLQKSLVQEFMHVIAPYSVMVAVTLFTDSKVPEMEQGVAYAKSGSWPEAIETFKSACAHADQLPDLKPEVRARCHYDLAVAYGYSGIDYDEAQNEIKRAIAIKPEPAILMQPRIIEGFRMQDAKLREQTADQQEPAARNASRSKKI